MVHYMVNASVHLAVMSTVGGSFESVTVASRAVTASNKTRGEAVGDKPPPPSASAQTLCLSCAQVSLTLN